MDAMWINGSIVSREEARIDPFDHGLTTGDGIFEATEVVRGSAFAASRHLRRLRRSADALGLVVPYSDAELKAALDEIAATAPERSKIRLTMTGGLGPLGSGRHEGPATVMIACAGPGSGWDDVTSVHIVPWTRNENGAMAGVKSTSYAENVVALAAANKVGASEAIFANTAGNLCEGTGSNVFVAIDGQLITPPLASGCLAGVTREILLETVDVAERDLPMTALDRVEEAFLTSATRRVQPIGKIDGMQLPAPGPLTQAAAEAFDALLSATTDP